MVESLSSWTSVPSLFIDLRNRSDSRCDSVRGAEPEAAVSSEEAVQHTCHDPRQHQ